jgi:hypothetical protein
MYAKDKGFKFHSEGWERRLSSDPRSHVVAIEGVTHWLMLGGGSRRVNDEMEKFLRTGGFGEVPESAGDIRRLRQKRGGGIAVGGGNKAPMSKSLQNVLEKRRRSQKD